MLMCVTRFLFVNSPALKRFIAWFQIAPGSNSFYNTALEMAGGLEFAARDSGFWSDSKDY